jgi:hypothetical protein
MRYIEPDVLAPHFQGDLSSLQVSQYCRQLVGEGSLRMIRISERLPVLWEAVEFLALLKAADDRLMDDDGADEDAKEGE